MEKLLPQCFQKMCIADTLKQRLVWERFNPFPNKPWVLHVSSTSLLKTLCQKEKLLVTISPFPSVFYIFGELSAIFIEFKIVVCKLFQFGPSKKFVVWEKIKLFFISIKTNSFEPCSTKRRINESAKIFNLCRLLPNDKSFRLHDSN